MLVADELDLADLDRRAFLDTEVDLHRGGRDGLDVGLDDGELVAVLCEEFREYGFGAHHLGRIVLAFHREADLLLFEAVEDIGGRDGTVALVIDFADGGPFLDEDVEDDAFLRVFAFDAQVLEVAGVPEGVEVAFDRDWIVRVPDMGEHTGEDGFLWNTPVADDADRFDDLRLLGDRFSS